jgi:hypothetical protein
MKKLLAIFVIFALACGGLFALDLGNGLEVTGGVNTGISVDTKNPIAATPPGADEYQTTVRPYSADEDGVFGVNLAARYTAGRGGFAFKIANGTLAAGMPGMANWAKFPYAYGWVNFLQGDIITLYGGAIDGALWGTTSGNVLDTSSDAITGVRLAIKPIEGLSFGFSLPFGTEGTKLADNFKEILFGAAYEADLFKVHATFDLVGENTLVGQADSAVAILFSATVTPMEALAIDFDFLFRTEAIDFNNYYNLQGEPRDQLKGYKGFDTGLRATYTAGPLTAYGKFKILGPDGGDIGLGIGAGVFYQVIPALKAKLELGSDDVLALDTNGLWVKIGGAVPIDGGFGLSFYDKISGIGKDGDGVIANEVNLSLTWSF